MPILATNSNLFMIGGGNKKPALVNSWNWPSIPARFLPTSKTGVNPTGVFKYS